MIMNPRNHFINALVLIVLIVSCSSASGQYLSTADVYKLPSCPADHKISYGADSLQFGELRLPSGSGPFPVAIIFHGGCWLASVADVGHTAPLSDALRNEDIATWNIEYSRIGHPRGGWPGTFKDVALGVDHLREIADDYNLDLKRVIVIGHSAGAHFALWVAARHKMEAASPIYSETPLPVRGVVALAAPVDLENNIDLANQLCADSLMFKLVGGLPGDVPKNYYNVSPLRLLPIGVPQRLIIGEHDIPLLLEHLAVYTDSALVLNEDIKLDTVLHAAHHEPAVPGSIAWTKVRAAIKSLLGLSE
jgi:acetyl esterase/lipase